MHRRWNTLATLCLTLCIVSNQVRGTPSKAKDKAHEEELKVPVSGGAKVVVPVKNEEETSQSSETAEDATLDEYPDSLDDALAEFSTDESDWLLDDEEESDETKEAERLTSDTKIPDVLDAAGVRQELVDTIDYEFDEDKDYIRRTATIKYKKADSSSNRQVDTWLQTARKGSSVWSTFLKGRRFLQDEEQAPSGQPDFDQAEPSPAPSTTENEEPLAEPTAQYENGEVSMLGSETNEEKNTEDSLTDEQLEAKELYDDAMNLLTSGTISSSKRAYQLLVGAAALNHSVSKELVAFSYLVGDYLTRNVSKALQMFEELNDLGHPRGQLGLGIMYAAGIQVNSSQAKALIYFTFSALGGDELAQMILGYRHLSGVGVQSSCETALIYYGKAARKVADQVSMSGGPVVQRIRLYDEGEATATSISNVLDDDLIQYYQFLADKGDTSAQVGLGQLYYQGGRGVAVDYDLAFYYFMQASEGGDPIADAYVGRMYAEGVGNVEQNYEIAHSYFLKSAQQENPIGQCGLGMLYLKGHYVQKNLDKAFHYFQKSADKNWVDGQLQLGLMYFKGEGVKKDHKAALKYFNLASQGGNVLALYNLGQMHASGLGVMRACHTAVELYKNVAERGPWSKMLMEAFDFYKRGYVDVAMLKYLMAAELGYEVAQSNVGHILDTGESDAYESAEKYKRALMQWSRAAGQGSTVARIKLGDYHYYGLGTTVDYEQAIQHYRVAGEQQSNAQAMYNLAYMHEVGLGLKQDLHLAKRFYDMAAETSKDAHLPVTLALARLSFMSQLDTFSDTSNIWLAITNLHPQMYLGPSWDMYLITILGMLFGLIIMLRNHLLQPA